MRNAKKQNNNNLLIAVIGLVICSLVSAIYTAWTCGYVLDSFESSQCMALIISDTGIKSDDANLQHQLSAAGMALQNARDFGYALGVGSFGVLVAVVIRIRRQSRS
jgi:hypothetical protein